MNNDDSVAEAKIIYWFVKFPESTVDLGTASQSGVRYNEIECIDYEHGKN